MTQRVVNYTYGTGNTVLPNGSVDVRDGIDNLQSFDVFMNADEDTYNQRDGEIVKTRSGAVRDIGVQRIGDFTTGCTVTARNQGVLEVGGSVYVWLGVLPKVVPPASTPGSTGGIYPAGEWSDIGDATIRYVLSGPDHAGLNGFYGGGGWGGSDAPFWNFYSNPADPITNALRQRFSLPVTDEQGPILWLEKKSSVTRADGVSRWDNGALYASLLKESGSAFGTALTGAVRYTGGSGDAIAMHGRVQSEVAGAQSFAGWFMNSAFAGSQGRVVGIEVDARSYLDVLSWRSSGGVGQYTVINCTSGGGTYGVHEYIRIPPKPAESEQRAWTGILFGQNTIHITDTSDNGEAVRIRGSSFASGRYGGIAIGDASDSHFMTFGLRMVNADFAANRAIQLADGHRMYWGANLGSGSGKWVEGTATNLFNIQNMSIAMSGVRVLSGRQTGIFQLTGTADGATKNTETVTLQELARYVKKVTDALITHGMIGPT